MFVSRNSHLFEIVIKPKAGEGNITDLYRALNIRDKAPSLQNCFVDTVALNLHGRHMAITFRSEDLADRKQFDALHANLTEHFRDMKIDFDLRYTNPEITPKIALIKNIIRTEPINPIRDTNFGILNVGRKLIIFMLC